MFFPLSGLLLIKRQPMNEIRITDSFIQGLCAPIRDIADRAGLAILDIVERGFDVTTKEDRSPVTDADHAAEAIILPALAKLTPGIPVVSEEAAAQGDAPSVQGDTFWLVDPLDGTREFVQGGIDYAVCIGLIAGGKPVFGLIHGPAKGITYWTSTINTPVRAGADGIITPIAARKPPDDELIAITSRFHGKAGGRQATFLESIPMTERILMGSALKFGRLAEGSADVYPRFGPTSEWDTCAGDAILRAAGGSIKTLDGKDLTYGKPKFLNPDFMARGIS